MIREVDEHGQPRLPMLVFGKPCDACMKTDRYWACNHNRHERSPWKSEEKEKRWAWIWRGDMTTFSTEAYGFNPPVNRKMLDPKCIAQMRAAPRRPCLVAPTLIYVALDFAEGGDDDVAIIGGYYEGDFTLVIVYLDAFKLKGGSTELKNQRIETMYRKLTNHPKLKGAGIVYIPENLPAAHGAELAYHFQNVWNVCVMREFGQDKRPGVPKTDDSTNQCVLMMRNLFNSRAVCYSECLMSYNDEQISQLQGVFEEQMLAMEYIREVPKHNTELSKTPRGKWTGKRSILRKDDMAVAAVMIPYWRSRFIHTPCDEYVRFITQFASPGRRYGRKQIGRHHI